MAKTTTKKTEPKRFVCRECSKRTHLGETLDSGFFCQACYDRLGEENRKADEGEPTTPPKAREVADFGKVARAMGLEGKLTATVAGEGLVSILNELTEELGPYGHGAITLQAANEKKQGTRMLKVECEETGYKVRLTRKWLDELGAPLCPCHHEPMPEAN